MRTTFCWLVALAAPLLAVPMPAAASSWQAGLGRVNITPEQPLWMSGYAARDKPAEGKLTDLWAKCLALEDPDGARAVLVTLDLIGLNRDLSAEVCQELRQRFHLPREGIILSASHTHTGPVVGGNLRAMYFFDERQAQLVEEYAAGLKQKLVHAVEQALADLQPARLSWAAGRATFAVNRRNNPEPDVPELRQAGRLKGPFDHDVPVLAVHGKDDRLRALLCGYACHATVLSFYQWSGDWPGFAQIALETRHPQAQAMFWAGCGADQNPLPRRSVDLARQYGEQLADTVDAALAGPMQPVTGSLRAIYAEVPLRFARVPSRAELQQAVASKDRFEAGRARLLLAQLDRDGAISPTYPYPVQTWQVGQGPLLVVLGGEVVVDYALRLKAELGAARTWVMAYANDVMAYIPSRRVLGEGGYEGAGAMLYYGQPSAWADDVEDCVVAEVHRQVDPGRPQDESGASPALYPNHDDLWVYLDGSNRPQMIRTPSDWERRRQQILDALQRVMGPLPGRDALPPLEVRVQRREAADGYERLQLTYQAELGNRVPAFLLLPTGSAGPRPAMLCLHQTTLIGKAEPAGLGGNTNLAYSHELARRGYVCLVPDYPSFGDLAGYDFEADAHASGTMKGIVNHLRGVDLLAERPEVDASRIGVIGHSLGGHNAMFAAVFDPRLKVVVSSCGWTPFHDYYGGKLDGWASPRYMPRLRTRYGLDPNRVPFDFHEIIAALAPRGFFSNSPLHDDNFAVAGVRKAAACASGVYELLGVPDRLVVRYPGCGHEFPPAVREEAYTFVDSILASPTRPLERHQP